MEMHNLETNNRTQDFLINNAVRADHSNNGIVIVNGILTPKDLIAKRVYSFQLLTDDKTYNLDVPYNLLTMLKKHFWELVTIKGILSSRNIIQVKAAYNENPEFPMPQDSTKGFDVEFFKRQVEHGFFIEPHLEEIA